MLCSFANAFYKLVLNNEDGQAWPEPQPLLTDANVLSNNVCPMHGKEDH